MLQFKEDNLSLREEGTNVKLKPRRFLAFLGVILLAIGGYVGWQIYQGQQLASQYETDALKLAQGSGSGSTSAHSSMPSSKGGTNPSVSPDPTFPASASSATTGPLALNSEFSAPLSFPGFSAAPVSSSSPGPSAASGSQLNSAPPSATSSAASAGEYKQLMSDTCQKTLQTMQTVKANTLALQGKKMSIFAYRASIAQSQAAFSSAEDFVRANPPTEENLNSSYQEFLAGIDLAKQSMDVVLNGISSLSPSNLYAARAMGKKAQQQVSEGFAHL